MLQVNGESYFDRDMIKNCVVDYYWDLFNDRAPSSGHCIHDCIAVASEEINCLDSNSSKRNMALQIVGFRIYTIWKRDRHWAWLVIFGPWIG